ncbi:LysR family transcriptional regulator [Thioclava kandeliae]|uniref:LysR substrate-binding domain-containing protein n=1 Tax=Thioclava kandeliae TaxID=3070818 RepID=A0ABV1SI30_9RHOB
MDLVDELRAFVATAQTRSFTAAADQLGLSNRLTSKYVAALETRLGTRLFQRTTRKVGLTPAGEDLMARAPALLDDLDLMISDIADGARGLSGLIRISAPVTFGEAYLAEMLARFGEAHPDLSIDLRLSDQFADLAGDGIDLAFRIGQLDAMALKSRKIGVFGVKLAASPAYLARNGPPARLADLENHNCIIDNNRRTPRRWRFANGTIVTVNGRFQVNSARVSCRYAEMGLGITYCPDFALRDALDAGSLVEILPEETGESFPVNIVYLEGQRLPTKLRALVDFAREDMKRSGLLTV